MDTSPAVDVLVIGGGLAGMYAALTAADSGSRVALVSKGPIGRSGGSIFAGTLVSFADHREPGPLRPDERPMWERKLEHIAFYHYLMDADHMIRSEDWIRYELLPELERMGLYFRRESDGLLLHNPDKTGETWTPREGLSGRVMGDLLRRRILDREITVHEECMVTSLVVDGPQGCTGGTVLDIVTGRLFAIPAKTTILATGHANFLAPRSTATREVCGDGLSLPARAGAELFNIEMQQWHVSDMAWPPCWMRVHVYPNPLPGTSETSRLVSDAEELLFEQKIEPGTLPYANQHYRLYQHAQRQGIPYPEFKNGGYYSDVRHIDQGVREKYSYLPEFFKKVGVDPGHELIENAPSFHYMRGGVWVDFVSMESAAVPHLYAAGGAAARDGQTNCMYDGYSAARHAADAAQRLPEARLPAAELAQEDNRVARHFAPAAGEPLIPVAVKNRIREAMWTHMDYVKTAAGMKRGLDAIRRIREEDVPRMRVSSTSKRYNYDLVDALDAHCMLDACELQISASLTREESRGPFFREDFPCQDNPGWLHYIVVSRQADEVRVRTEAVNLDGLGPIPAVEDPFPHRETSPA